MGDGPSREDWTGGVTLCLHHFCGSTEKQDVRELPGLPRSRDPGEGELEGCVQEREEPEEPLDWSRRGTVRGGADTCKPHQCY